MTPLATLLARIGWTTGELARRLDVPARTIRQWHAGTRPTPLNVLDRLARVARTMDAVWSLPVAWTGVRPGRPVTTAASVPGATAARHAASR